MHKFPKDANLRRQWVKFGSTEESKFRRADGAFGYLQNSFFSGLLRKKFHGGNGPETRGGYLTKFNTGRLRPEVQPLTLSYTILAEKVPLLYTFH